MTNFVECDECKGMGRKVVAGKKPDYEKTRDIFLKTVECPHCKGTGHVEIKETPHIQERPKRVRDW